MMPPRPCSGSSTQASWLNRLLGFAQSLVLLPGRGYTVSRTTHGTFLEINNFAGGGGADVGYFQIVEELDDCLKCSQWNGTDFSGTVYVAKPDLLRQDIATEVIDGETITYTYLTEHRRTATGSVVESHVIRPPFLVGNKLKAFKDPRGFETVDENDEEITTSWTAESGAHAWTLES